MKNKLTKQVLPLLLVFAMVLSFAPVSAFAAPSTRTTQTTRLSYESEQTDWIWTIPAAQVFTDDGLALTGDVSILPADEGDTIVLPPEAEIVVTMSSAANFYLVNETNPASQIPYEVAMTSGGEAITSGSAVLTFTAGVSDNTGISQTLHFSTTAANIKQALVTGLHADVLTFTLNAASSDPYRIIEGANQMNYGSGSAYFRSTGGYDEFVGVQVDGNDLNDEDYTSAAGSTKIYLPQSYLSTLSVGTHTIDIVFDGGVASTQFTLWRNGEVEYDDEPVFYYPSANSSVANIISGTPVDGDAVAYGDYLYVYFDGDVYWQRVCDIEVSLAAALADALIGTIGGVNPEYADVTIGDSSSPSPYNSGWICLFAGIDPYTIEANENSSDNESIGNLSGAELDYSRASYGSIESSIHGIPVISLFNTFGEWEGNGLCNDGSYDALVSSPAIPSSVLAMSYTYKGSGLTNYPTIPSSVYTIVDPFDGCHASNATLTLNMDEIWSPELVLRGLTGTVILGGNMSYAAREEVASYAEEGLTVILDEDYAEQMLGALLQAPLSELYTLIGAPITVDAAHEDTTLQEAAEELYATLTEYGFDISMAESLELCSGIVMVLKSVYLGEMTVAEANALVDDYGATGLAAYSEDSEAYTLTIPVCDNLTFSIAKEP